MLSVKYGPVSFGCSGRGIDLKEQENSIRSIVEIIRSNLHVIKLCYEGDFEDEVFVHVKGNHSIFTTPTDDKVVNTTQSYTEWLMERQKTVTAENTKLRNETRIMQMNIKKLQEKISFLQSLLLN